MRGDLRGVEEGEQYTVLVQAAARQAWFQQVLQSALVATVTDAYADFSAIGRAALAMTAERRGVTLSDQGSGVRLAALTNSPPQVAEAQLTNAGLRDLFEQALSADAVHRLKPAPEPYRLAAERLDVPIGQIRLVAAHAWDVAGALRTGCAAAFVGRPGQVLDPLVPRPDVVGGDLRAVAAAILERERLSGQQERHRAAAEAGV